MLAFEPADRAPRDWHDWVSQSGGRFLRGGPGTLLFVPASTPHTFANRSGRPVRMLFPSAPSGHEDYFEELAALLSASAVREPDPGQIAELRRRYTIFEQAAPSYKARHMWMAGLERDEPAFDAMAAGYDLREAIAGMPMPWYVVGGEADDLSPNHWVYDLADRCPAAVTTLMYDGATHSMDQSSSVILGPPWRVELIDWLSAWVTTGAGDGGPAGKQFHERVTRTGQVVPR